MSMYYTSDIAFYNRGDTSNNWQVSYTSAFVAHSSIPEENKELLNIINFINELIYLFILCSIYKLFDKYCNFCRATKQTKQKKQICCH